MRFNLSGSVSNGYIPATTFRHWQLSARSFECNVPRTASSAVHFGKAVPNSIAATLQDMLWNAVLERLGKASVLWCLEEMHARNEVLAVDGQSSQPNRVHRISAQWRRSSPAQTAATPEYCKLIAALCAALRCATCPRGPGCQ